MDDLAFENATYKQGEGSGILILAATIPEGQPWNRADIESDVAMGYQSSLKPKQQLRHLLWADRVITGTNGARRQINRMIVDASGLGPYPVGHQDEKLICLHNYADAGLFDGSPVRLRGVVLGKREVYGPNSDDGGEIWTDCGVHGIYLGHFDATFGGWTQSQSKIARAVDDLHIDENSLIELDWGFASTCHKAQGSEWPNVLVIYEDWPYDPEFRRRWYYTAVTRGRSKLRIIIGWDFR